MMSLRRAFATLRSSSTSLRSTSLLATILVLAVSQAAGWAATEPAPIGPGAIYQEIYRPEGPWAIHVVEADLSQEYLELEALLGGGETMARRPLSAIAGAAHTEVARPVAAINGDYFSLASGAGLPLGLHVENGELVTFPDPSRSVFYVLADGTMHIDRLRANAWLRAPDSLLLRFSGMNRPPGYADLVLFTPRFGDQTQADPGTTQIALVGLTDRVHPNVDLDARVASITTGPSQRIPPEGAVIAARGVQAYALRKLKVGDEVTLSLWLEPEKGQMARPSAAMAVAAGDLAIEQAVSGGPRLVRDGAISVEHLRERFAASFAGRRHPRSGLGIRNGTLVMVAVDGRQPGYSEGMTLHEFAKLFVELNCTDAMNLDGGGSTTMVVRDRVVNSPSGGAERALVNALGVLTVAPVGPPVQLALEPAELSVLSGERVSLRPTGLDQYYNPVAVDVEAVQWEAAPALGSINKLGVFAAASVKEPAVGLVLARMGKMTASSVVHITPGPARVVVTPASVSLSPGATQQFVAEAYDEDNDQLAVSPGRMAWRTDPAGAGATISASGLLKAPARNATLAVLACVGDVCGRAEVLVGEEVAVVETFEKPGQWRYRAEPASAPGGLDWTEDRLRPRNHCLQLRYDLSQGTGTRTAYADLNLQLPEAGALSVNVLGDGQGAWLRARLRDGAGRVFSLDLAKAVSWRGSWRRLTAPLPAEAESPVTLECVYLAEIHDEHKPTGAIWLDDIAVGRAPVAVGGGAAGNPAGKGRE
jgi:uncharacterized protein YigE (DUF2233 family)